MAGRGCAMVVDLAGAQEPRAELQSFVEITVRGEVELAGAEAKREGMGRKGAWRWGPALSNAFPGLDFKAAISPGDLPAGTYRSCTPWGPAEEEIQANNLGF